jgi:hypothetical protein
MGSGTFSATPSGHGGRRAFQPGARAAVVGALVAALVLAGALVLILGSGGRSRYPAQDLKYGSLPSWLPNADRTPAATKPQYEVATVAKPVLEEEQGYTVHAELPTGSVDITAVGPQFPAYVTRYAQENLWPDGKLLPSTFYVTFADVNGTIPIAAGDFSVLTDTGQIMRARLHARSGGAVPASVHSGQTVTIAVQSRAVEGQGSIRWAPRGPKVLVGWLYQLELD